MYDDIKVNDIVKTYHPFLFLSLWKVTQIFPSIHKDQQLYRIQLLTKEGEIDNRFRPIVVTRDFIKERLGGENNE